MNIVFAHYHLNAGGVTQVIVNQLRALAQLRDAARPRRVGVLYGGRHEGWPPKVWEEIETGSMVPFEEVLMPLPLLDYDPLAQVREEQLANEVEQTLTANGFAAVDTVLHIHNHSLGKNASWAGAITLLVQRGYRVLLQIHDFVEDFRPANYRYLARAWNTNNPHQLALKQYPQGSAIHYAVLTERDRQLLAKAGVADEHLHTLPNPVGEFVGLKAYEEVAPRVRGELGIPTDATLVLYPVRGIRRKNLGELMLFAAVSSPNTWHAVTLAPENPLELPSFERWRLLADELDIRCLFDTCGAGPSPFLDALAAADTLITTSVAEGFGMVYLEAWIAGKPLVGRDLPGITSEFKAAGLEFQGLYQALYVPLSLFDNRADLAETLQVAYEWASDSYGVRLAGGDEIAAEIDKLLSADRIDFALLPSRFQEHVIRAAAKDPAQIRQLLIESNPGLDWLLNGVNEDAAVVENNAAVVRSKYSLYTISKHLSEAYEAIMSEQPMQGVEPAEKGGAILEQFLRLQRLHAIRFEE